MAMPVVLNQENSVPQGTWQYLKTFLIVTTGMGRWEAENYWYQVVKARAVAKHPATHRTAPHDKNLASPKCQ